MSPMISVVSWAVGPTSAPVIPKTFHNPGTPFDGGGGGGGSGSGYGSAYFDGTGDSLDVGTFTIGTDAFTIESWFQPKFNTSGSDTVFLYDVSSEDIRVTFKNGNIRAQLGSETELSYSIGTLDQNKWYHTALQRDSSGNVNLYYNGIDVGNYSASGQNVSGNTLRIGDKQAGSKEYTGYISNFRIVRGDALYPPSPLGIPGDGPQGTGSCFFDGADDHIELVSQDNPGLRYLDNAANFTVEAWAYFTDPQPTDENNIFEFSTGDRIIFGRRKQASGRTCMYMYSAATSDLFVDDSAHDIPSDEWVHLAWVKQGTNIRMYKNGVNVVGNGNNSATNMPANMDAAVIHIGENYDGNEPMKGYLSNVRYSTTARYTSDFDVPTGPFVNDSDTTLIICHRGDQIKDIIGRGSPTANGGVSASYSSPFLESTTPLTDITNTKLLTCNTASGTITDASSNNHTVTTNGDTVASVVNPFSNIGSTFFDGGEDYLKFPNAGTSNNLVIGTNDFTLEFWIKADSFTNGGVIYDTREGHANSLMVNFNTSGNLRLYANSGYRITADGISTGVWTHYAIVRDSGTTKLFLNGIQDSETYSDTNNYTGDTVFIGRHQSGVNVADFDGYISNLRLVVGTALYPPASGGSAYFDGTDDLLKISNNTSFRLGTGDFTIETWVYFDDTSLEGGSNRRIFNLHETGNAVDNLQIVIDNGGYRQAGDLFLYSNSVQGYLDTDIRSGWHHIAVVRNSGTLKFYLDGVSKYSASNTQDYSPGGVGGPRPTIGSRGDDKGDYNGYLSNFRMVVGTAVYTSNFTVPTAPLTDITNTQLLTCQNTTGSITDASSNSHVVNTTGNVSASSSSPFVESATPLTDITNTKLLTANKGTGAITDESSIGHSVHVNSNAQPSTENPF